jgi:MFS family permease
VNHGRNGSDDHANAVCGLLRTLVAGAPMRITPEVMAYSRLNQRGTLENPGYFIFEVPSNLILERVGARRWIARIMISWAVCSASFAFVPSISAIFQSLGFSFFDNARTFYLIRFIFGAAEAGFFSGIILYLTYWFMADERGRWVGVFFTGVPLSLVIGGPIGGFILDTSTALWALVDGNGCSLSRACHLFWLGYGL